MFSSVLFSVTHRRPGRVGVACMHGDIFFDLRRGRYRFRVDGTILTGNHCAYGWPHSITGSFCKGDIIHIG